MIFQVTPAHIEELSDTDLRTLIGYLAEREIVTYGHSPAAVTYGGDQRAKDGGIDVRVALTGGKIDGFVPRQETGYQAKAEVFSAADIKKEMRPKGKLRNSILELGKNGGAYIIVSSKGSVSDSSLKQRKKAMAEAIADEPDASPLHLDFFDKQRIATWVNQHPGIVAWVRARAGYPISGWKPCQDWSSSPVSEAVQYVMDDGLRLVSANAKGSSLSTAEGIDALRSILAKPKGVVRLVGLSGVGKTRLVQALFEAQIGVAALDKLLAVYTDIGDRPAPVPTELLSRLKSNGQRCILIVDNCGSELHRKLVSCLSMNSKISLITVEYDIREDEPENTDVFKLEPATKEVISRLLKPRHPKLTESEIRTIADFSEGNFRIALALANTSKDGRSLANLKDTELFNRLFWQKNEVDPALLRAAKVCSLVFSFDLEATEGAQAEAPLLAQQAEQSVSEFHGHVAELKRRQLIQARGPWRALLPHAVAHRLAKLALEDLPPGVVRDFIRTAPERLLKSFSRRLGCLHDVVQAQQIVAEWLADDDMLSALDKRLPLWVTILANVAPVQPEMALNAIQNAAARNEGFTHDNTNANSLVRLLRSLAYCPDLFDQAATVIAQFARSKIEADKGNDAPNIFKSLFYMSLSGTHAPPEQRAILVRKLAATGSEADEALALTALEAMLECTHFSGAYTFEFGARARDYGHHPKTYDEQWSWYQTALGLAGDLVRIPSLRTKIRLMIAAQFSALAFRARLDDLIELADQFERDGGWAEGWAGARIALRKAKEFKDEECIRKLTELETKLTPVSMAHRIESYVLPKTWSALDIDDIDFDDEKRYEKSQKNTQKVCKQIGAELASDLANLNLHLPKLLASQSPRVFTVAEAIGREASDPSAAWKIIEANVFKAARSGEIFFFPGRFLLGLSEQSRTNANEILDYALANPRWHPFLPHMQLCVGLDEVGIKRLIAAIPSPALPSCTLRALAGGRSTDELGDSDLKELIGAIADKESGANVALEIFHTRLFSLRSDQEAVSEVERDIARALLPKILFDERNNREPRMFTEIVRLCLRNPPDIEIANEFCVKLIVAINRGTISCRDIGESLTELAKIFPRVVLEAILEPEGGVAKAPGGLFGNFGDNPLCPFGLIDADALLTWAKEAPETRFPALAATIHGWDEASAPPNPPITARDEDTAGGLKWTSTSLRLIHEAPDPIVVLEEFSKKFRPSGWSGSYAESISRHEILLISLFEDSNEHIQKWAKEELPRLREDVEEARKLDASIHRGRHEQFEW